MDRDDSADDGAAPTVIQRGPARREQPPSPAPAAGALGDIGERYRLTGEIGRGGMGEVIAARDRQIGREVAIKRMRGARPPSAEDVARFMREARIQGRLEHPAIPAVHELGRDSHGRPYFAMKKLAGTTLAAILQRAEPPFTRHRLLRAFADVCLAVEFAHTRGVIHRDLKPDNIMLGEFGEVYVLDWGIAKVIAVDPDAEPALELEPALDPDPARAAVAAGGGVGAEPDTFTKAGTAIGTPGYMAPEQVLGEVELDARADVYALGCVLFEILAGDTLHPMGAPGMMSVFEGKDPSPARRAPERDIAPELDALCVAATAAERDDRLPTARALGERIQRYLDGDRDLALRHELSERHHAAALAAYGAGDRPVAMREAARAIALHPGHRAAAALITRLMLDPPPIVPAEVNQALARDSAQILIDHSRLAFWGYAVIAAYVPIVLARAPLGVAIAFVVADALTLTCAGLAAFARRQVSLHVFVAANALLVGVLAMLLSPILLAPSVAALTGLVFVLDPLFEPWPRVTAIAATIAAFSLPWLGQAIGVLPPMLHIDATGIHLFAAGLRGDPMVTVVLVVTTAMVTAVVAVLVGYGIRVRDIAVRQRLHLQAWQLRQLVPE